MYKKGKKEEPGNYQPSSLSSIPGRVREQLVLQVILKGMEDKIISSSEHVCQPKLNQA